MPWGAWDILENTLVLDAKAKNFDPKLRKAIKKALDSIQYFGMRKD